MGSVLNAEFVAAIRALPPELREYAERWGERLDTTAGGAAVTRGLTATLARLVASSEFAAATLHRQWPWFVNNAAAFAQPPDNAELRMFARGMAAGDEPFETARRALREYRNRYLLHVLWREVAGAATLTETLDALSELADQLLVAAAGYAERMLHERFGRVRDADGNSASIVILGMGKLGGRELNFSSDIDLIFLYPGGSESDGEKRLSAQEYFARVGRHIVSLLDEPTADGFAFRIDTRLRPYGDSGPPVTSFGALESYLQQQGRGWERYAYVKARVVGPRPDPAVESALMQGMVTPFVYRRYLDYGVFESLREMHGMIAAEVQRKDMADNIKLGPGGIREIEFIVQSLQLVRGGSRPELQSRELLEVLPRLVGRSGLEQGDAAKLADAYRFLRRLENFIQAIRDQQTHDLPKDPVDRLRLCVAMEYPAWDALLADIDRHRAEVARQFGLVALREQAGGGGGDRSRVNTLWDAAAPADDWAGYFEDRGLTQARELAERVAAFAAAPATQRVDAVSRQRLREFMPRLLVQVGESGQPVVALNRVLAIVEKILRRSAYLALLIENAGVLRGLVRLCEQSAYVANQIAMFPVLLDELLDPRIYTARITRKDLEAELRNRLEAAREPDSEGRMAVLGQFQRASMFRIAVADFNGSLPVMRVSDSLSDLAETVLDYALGVAWQDLTERHGEPEFVVDGERRRAGFGIIAYGKLGGIELSYGSDLDIVFLHDSRGSGQVTNGRKPLDNTMFFSRLVRRLVHFLTTQTGSGVLYEVDMRLRPDGRRGLLFTSTEAFERYQEENAWTWEHQALLRARPVAGSAVVAREFERIRAETLRQRVRRDSLRADVLSMRGRMRKELDASDAEWFDLKQGAGGIGDIEFLVQYLVLANAYTHPAVIHYPDNVRQLATLAAAGCLDEDIALQLQDIYREYRLRLHHQTLNEQDARVPQTEFAAERAAVTAAWEKRLGADTA